MRTCSRFWVAQPQPNYCEPATNFGLRGDNRTIANLRKILGCVRLDNFAIASSRSRIYPQLLSCQTTKPPRVCYCVTSDLFAMKRCFRYQESSWYQRQIQPTRGPKTDDSAISPNAAWSACNFIVGTLPQPDYCDTDFGLQSFRLANHSNCTSAKLRQILGCAARAKLLRTCEKFWIA